MIYEYVAHKIDIHDETIIRVAHNSMARVSVATIYKNGCLHSTEIKLAQYLRDLIELINHRERPNQFTA